MIGWLLRKISAPATDKPADAPRSVSPENCALWHDVVRALDSKPRAVK